MAHAFRWECSYERLKLGQLLGHLGILRPLGAGRILATTHPLHTGPTKIFGASISETTTRPNPAFTSFRPGLRRLLMPEPSESSRRPTTGATFLSLRSLYSISSMTTARAVHGRLGLLSDLRARTKAAHTRHLLRETLGA